MASANYKTPYVGPSIKSAGLEHHSGAVNGHLISDFEGNLIQQSMLQHSQGLFNSQSKNKQVHTSFARESLQFTPRRVVSGLPGDGEARKAPAAYIDNQKSTSTQPAKKHTLNAVLVQNSYYNKAAAGLMYNP
jgi:hypothetical protein